MIRNLAFFVVTVLFCLSPFSQSNAQQHSEHRDKVEKEISQLLEKYNGIGVAVGVIKNRELIYSDGFGLKDSDTQEKLTAQDLFRIASISKSFSATAVMQLVEKGELSLDDEVSKLVGFEVKNPKHPDTPITLRMLLNHTSSINDSQGYFTLDAVNPKVSESVEKAFNDYKPGTQYQYCNLNYNMTGAIIERISGTRFDDYMAKNILTPLGLSGGFNTNKLDKNKFVALYEYNAETKAFNKQPKAYAVAEDNYNNYEFGYATPRFSPTGGMKISAEDLAKYMDMHIGMGESRGVRVISEASAAEMQSINPKLGQYGLALMGKDNLIADKTLVGHTGSAYGLYSMMFFCPREKFGLVVITNGCDGRRLDGNIALLKEVSNVLYERLIKP